MRSLSAPARVARALVPVTTSPVTGVIWVRPAWSADGEVVIRATTLAPHVPRWRDSA